MADQTLEEELEVLSSIYAESFSYEVDSDRIVSVKHDVGDKIYRIEIVIGELYPNDSSKLDVYVSSDGYYLDQAFTVDILSRLAVHGPSNILYQLIEDVKEYVTFHPPAQMSIVPEKETPDLYVEPEPTTSQQVREFESFPIVHGPYVVEQKSTFQAHVAVVQSIHDVDTVRRVLMYDKKVATATHNIMAFRFTDPDTGVVHHDCDDDGECAAGGRLAEMLRLMGSTNVIVVVSRWFGGVLLGPSRFKFICNTARNLLEDQGMCEYQKRSKRGAQQR